MMPRRRAGPGAIRKEAVTMTASGVDGFVAGGYRPRASGTRVCRAVYLLAVLAFIALLVRHHVTLVMMPIPLDLYEGQMPLITGIIASGHNPYTAEFQPQAMSVYPPLYNLLVAPLTAMFANDLVLHRIVSAVFILAACAVFGFATWRRGADALMALASAAAVYAGLVFYSTPVASTNALGVFLFAASLVVPWLARFSVPGLIACAVLGLLGFYAKQYFILGVAIVCLYVFLYVSAARALILGVAFLAALLGSLALVHWTSPYFLDNTLFSTTAAVAGLRMWSMVTLQLREFVTIYSGYLAILAMLAAVAWRHAGWRGTVRRLRQFCAVRGWSWRQPLLARPLEFFGFGFFWSTLAVVATLGQNPGNYMTYLFQLMSPLLLVSVFGMLSRLQPLRWWPLPLLLLSFYQAYTFLPRDFTYDADNWARMTELIKEADQVLASQMLLMMLLENGKEIHHDGQTFYFRLAAGKPDVFQPRDPAHRVDAVWARYIAELYRKVEQREFDLIIVSPWEMRGIFHQNPPPGSDLGGKSFLATYYYPAEKIPLSMTDRQGGGTWNLQVWRPRSPQG